MSVRGKTPFSDVEVTLQENIGFAVSKAGQDPHGGFRIPWGRGGVSEKVSVRRHISRIFGSDRLKRQSFRPGRVRALFKDVVGALFDRPKDHRLSIRRPNRVTIS